MLRKILSAFSARHRLLRGWTIKSFGNIESPNLHVEKGLAHHKAGHFSMAEAAYARALEIDPVHADALHLQSVLAFRQGDLDKAEDFARDALGVVPDSPEYLNTLATLLSNMGRHEEALHALKRALDINPDALRARANLLFLLNIIPDVSRKQLLEEHIEWGVRHSDFAASSAKLVSDAANFPGSNAPGRLRVGYVSADFCSHPVGRIVSGIFECHNRRSIEVFCYDNGSDRDEVNSVLRAHAEHWMDVGGLSDEALENRIYQDAIQVLVDLSGHTRRNRLRVFGKRPAPVQATWLGYLNTTGVETIDWRITSARADPPPYSQEWHTERLWYLAECPWTWSPPAIDPVPAISDLPCKKLGYVTFGSFNTFRKINDEVIHTWARILLDTPGGRLRVYGAPGGRAVDRVYDLFESHGVDPSRVDLFASVDYQRYLLAYDDVDISLDPFPYNGGATTCESLWMGVPVITLAGSGGFSRSGASIAGAVGLHDLIATTTSEYVEFAVRLARDIDGLASLRGSLRKRLLSSPLANVQQFTRDLENAYHGMWQHWLEKQTNLNFHSRHV